MYFWTQAPFFRLLLPLSTGIITAVLFPFPAIGPAFFFSLILAASAILLVSIGVSSYRLRWIYGIPLAVGLFSAGYWLTLLRTDKLRDDHYSGKSFEWAEIVISEAPAASRVIARVISVRRNNLWERTRGRVLVYFPPGLKDSIAYGSKLLLRHSAFEEVQAPRNPEEFNYRRYLSHKGIWHRCFMRRDNSVLLKGREGHLLMELSYGWRSNLLSVLKRYLDERESAVASALLLGYTDEIDKSIIKEYSRTGVLHILSVSGMHVSLIYFLLDFILRSLRTIRMLRLLRTVVLLSFLWVYAIMSGFSPAILRAAFMLSFVISGELVNRNSYVFNTLFASAFCLLLINPYFITDIGFQLSYLAVGGILVLQPMLYGLSEFRNIAADMIWKSATVSIAAQLLTFPLGLFYFGSFPNYFLIANLLAIPLSTAAIYSCLLLLCASFSIWLSTLLGKLCTVIISSLNTTIRFFESLPLSFIEGISIHVPETILIYAFIFLMIAAWVYRGANLAFAAALALITALGSYVVRDCYSIRQKEIIVYSVPGRTAIGLISGRSETLLSLNGNSNIDRYAANYRRYRNIRDSRTVLARDTIAAGDGFFCRNNFVAFYERRFLILDKTFRLPGKRVGKVRLDFILITESPSVRLSDLTGFFEFERVVISSACNSPVADKLKNECARIKKSLHSVTEKAFILRSG